jgi:hypothetical protein
VSCFFAISLIVFSFPIFAQNHSDSFFIRYSEEKIADQFSKRSEQMLTPEEWVKKTLAFFHTPEAPKFQWSQYLPNLTRKCQIKLEKSLDPAIISKYGSSLFLFFQNYPPVTSEGWSAYSQLTQKLYPQAYPKVLNNFLNFWTEKAFSEEEEKKLSSFFSSQSMPDMRRAIQKKYQNLILKKRWKNIGYLVKLFPQFFPDRSIIHLALTLIEKNKKAEDAFQTYQSLSKTVQTHPLLSLGVFEFLIRHDQAEEALQEWNKNLFPRFASLALKLSSTLLSRSPQPLPDVLTTISQVLNPIIDAKTEDWYDASLAMGVMWYYEGNSPEKALPYFQKVLKSFQDRQLPDHRKIRLYTKASFFAGQCLRHPAFPKQSLAGKKAGDYFAQAARHPSLFYGQCASFLLNQKLVLPVLKENKSAQLPQPLQKKMLKIALMFKKQQLEAVSKGKEKKGENATNLQNDCIKYIHTQQYALPFLNLFQDWSKSSMVDMAHFLHYSKGFFFAQAYPVLQIQTPVPDVQLVHAIIFVESKFNPDLEGGAKERGLMQIVPVSGQEAAALLKVPFFVDKLWQKEYNVLIGNQVLQRWIKYFQGQYIYGIASYNAGPTPVRRWIANNPIHKSGDPEKDLEQMIYWIENIKYPMVRVYVDFVLSAYAIYCAQTQGPLTLKAWMRKPLFQ